VVLTVTPQLAALVVGVVLVAGAVNGVAGFGFAVVGTMVLATVADPATAVVFMIVPILSVNLSLVRELSGDQLRSCGTRFGPLLAAALIGTVLGMAALRNVPTAPLRAGLGLVSLGFVASVQNAVPLPSLSSHLGRERMETTTTMAAIGFGSGLLFGGTNVGVQLIAYVRSFDLSHGLFVGVVAMVFLGLNAVRVGAAAAFGLYPGSLVVAGSLAAAVPAVTGVAVGRRLRERVSDRARRGTVLALLSVIGLRLLSSGLGVA